MCLLSLRFSDSNDDDELKRNQLKQEKKCIKKISRTLDVENNVVLFLLYATLSRVIPANPVYYSFSHSFLNAIFSTNDRVELDT